MASDNRKNNSEFTLEECRSFLDSCDKCRIYSVKITGGEPLLHPNFLDIIYECKRRNIKIKEILTNASLINETILDKILETGINPIIKVSFDGIGYHDWMRGVQGAEENAIQAVKLLKNKGFRVYIQMCIHKNNLDSIYPTAKLFDSLNVDKMRVLRTCESPRWEQQSSIGLGIQEYYDISLKFLSKYANNNHFMPVEIFKFASIYPKYKNINLYLSRKMDFSLKKYRHVLK